MPLPRIGTDLKIKSVEPILCDGGHRPWTFVRIEANNGLVGYGDCTDWDHARSVVQCVKDLGELVIGEDPRRIEYIYLKLFRQSQRGIGGVTHKAIAGIDSALWDLKGKLFNVPVYDLLGGRVHDRIRLYWSHCGSHRAQFASLAQLKPVRTLSDLQEEGRKVVAAGFKALKTNLMDLEDVPDKPIINRGDIDKGTIRNATAIIGALREVVGPDIGIALDIAFKFRLGATISLARALEPFDMMWLETETLDPRALRTIRMSTRTPVCHGESLYSTHDFRPFLECHAQDVIMPDIAWNGVTMGLKLGHLSDAYDTAFSPHNCHSPLATAIAAHLCASLNNFQILEYDMDDVPWRDDIVSHPSVIRNGALELSDRPGFGMDLIESEIAKHPTDGRRPW